MPRRAMALTHKSKTAAQGVGMASNVVLVMEHAIKSCMLEGMHRSIFHRFEHVRAEGPGRRKDFLSSRQLLIIYLIYWRVPAVSTLSEDSLRNWRDISARVYSSTSEATMKVTTAFSCSRTRRGHLHYLKELMEWDVKCEQLSLNIKH